MKTNLFARASQIVAAIPGIGVLLTGLGTPPDRRFIYGVLIEVFGVLAILLLWLNKDRIYALRRETVTAIALVFGFLFLLFLFGYWQMYMYCVITLPNFVEHPVFFPMFTADPVSTGIADHGRRSDYVDFHGPRGAQLALSRMPHSDMLFLLTDVVLLLTYQGVFSSLVLTFGILGFHFEGTQLQNGSTTLKEPEKRTVD